MLVYISGPITGDENYKAAFSARAASLRAMGYQVENPVLIGENLQRMFPDKEITHAEYLTHDIAALLNCDGISMLDGWEESAGARIEHDVARATDKTFVNVKILEHKWNSDGR